MVIELVNQANKNLIGYTHHPLAVEDARQHAIDTFLETVIDWFRQVV